MSTMCSPPPSQGLASGLLLTVPKAGRPALIVLPSSREIITDGIAIPGSVPPIVNGAPPALFATIIATAPASWALLAFTVKLHPPRSTSAMEPAGKPASGWHPAGVVPTPPFPRTTPPVTPVAAGAGGAVAPPGRGG